MNERTSEGYVTWITNGGRIYTLVEDQRMLGRMNASLEENGWINERKSKELMKK